MLIITKICVQKFLLFVKFRRWVKITLKFANFLFVIVLFCSKGRCSKIEPPQLKVGIKDVQGVGQEPFKCVPPPSPRQNILNLYILINSHFISFYIKGSDCLCKIVVVSMHNFFKLGVNKKNISAWLQICNLINH